MKIRYVLMFCIIIILSTISPNFITQSDPELTLEYPSEVQNQSNFNITFNLNKNEEDISAWKVESFTYNIQKLEFIDQKIIGEWNSSFDDITEKTQGDIEAQSFVTGDYQSLPQNILNLTFSTLSAGTVTFSCEFKCENTDLESWNQSFDISITITEQEDPPDPPDDDDDNGGGETPTPPPPQNNPPEADFSYSGNLTENQTISFTDESTDSDGVIEAYTWYFDEFGSSTKKNPTFLFQNGTFDITLTVTDDDGATDSITRSITIDPIFHRNNETNTSDNTTANQTENITLKAIIICDANAMRADETIYFSGDRCIGENLQFEWEFGDGTNSTGSIVQHKYASKGTYSVNLTITNSTGHQDNATKVLTLSKAKQDPDKQENNENQYIYVAIILLVFIFIVFMLLFNYFRYR